LSAPGSNWYRPLWPSCARSALYPR
jgi:hypothetical protein